MGGNIAGPSTLTSAQTGGVTRFMISSLLNLSGRGQFTGRHLDSYDTVYFEYNGRPVSFANILSLKVC